MKITIQIILGKNEATIEKCLASILPLNGRIIAIDQDSDEKTMSACRSIGAEIVRPSSFDDLSLVRNSLIEDGINIHIEPWEILASGHDQIQSAEKDQSYFVQIIQGNMLWKETRVFGKSSRYSNPVYESLPIEEAKYLSQVVIYCQEGGRKDSLKFRELLENWKASSPNKVEPIYFSACEHLANREYEKFSSEANRYLFHSEPSRTKTMIRYYSAVVDFYHKKDLKSSVQKITHCIAEKPTMAEFWCLLGDIYCKKHLYDKAKAFFVNAMILGKQRSQSDFWPLDVPKYKRYPEKMISGCEKMLKDSRIYGAGK